MTYERFEDLPVWKAAQDLGADVYALVEDRTFNRMGDLRDQLQRASLSISNNIAEGFERGSTAELLVICTSRAGPQARRGRRCGLPRDWQNAASSDLKSQI